MHSFLQDWYGNLKTKIVPSVPCPACIGTFYAKSSAGTRKAGAGGLGAFSLQSVLQAFVDKSEAPLVCPQCKIRTLPLLFPE